MFSEYYYYLLLLLYCHVAKGGLIGRCYTAALPHPAVQFTLTTVLHNKTPRCHCIAKVVVLSWT